MRAVRVSLHRTLSTLTALILGVLITLGAAAPASAHDILVSSNPSQGQKLSTAPSQVVLTFNDVVINIGAEVLVNDPSGRNWATGSPQINRNVVTVALKPDMPQAGYEIRYRIVSADGHPVSAIIYFTVGDGTPFTDTPSTSAKASSGGSASSGSSSGASTGSSSAGTGSTGGTSGTSGGSSGSGTQNNNNHDSALAAAWGSAGTAGPLQLATMGVGGALVALAIYVGVRAGLNRKRRAATLHSTLPQSSLPQGPPPGN